jgi:phage gpG-like protein
MAIEPRVRVVDAEVKAAIRRVLMSLPLGGDGRPLFTMIGRHGKTDVQLNFRKQRSPDGVPWIPSRRVIERGGQTLRLTSRLRNSISYNATHDQAEVGTNVIYARRQHFGDNRSTASIFAALKAGRRIVGKGMPSRKFLGLSKQGSDGLLLAVNGFLDKRWSG